GVTAGFIGMVQANEVIKFLLGIGELLTGRLLIWDGMQAHAEEICVERNPACSACGSVMKKTTAGKKK
ncbi:MAG: adenylyltransferase, partial [Methanoregulaceae archaeon]|nr:adenylyltransferase [Methanoregulaceae archaeon]